MQNEDVDVGNGILLVTDDPYGGRGVVYVIDVRNPRSPRLLSTYSTYVPGLLVTDPTQVAAGAGRHRPHRLVHPGLPLCLAGGLARDGIEVVDLRDPARPRFAGRVRAAAASGLSSHDVQVDFRGLAWVAGGDGTAAYDTTNPVRPRLVTRTDRRGARGPYNDFIHHNSLRISDDTLLVTEEDFGDGCRRVGLVPDLADPGPHDAPAGPLRRGARRHGCGWPARPTTSTTATGWWPPASTRPACACSTCATRAASARSASTCRGRSMFWAALFAPGDPSVVYAIDHARGIDVLSIDRRRAAAGEPPRGAAPAQAGGASGRRGRGRRTACETARPGRRVTIELVVRILSGGGARNVAVEVQLPAALTAVRPPRGTRYDAAARSLRFTIPRLRPASAPRSAACKGCWTGARRSARWPRRSSRSAARDAFLVTNRGGGPHADREAEPAHAAGGRVWCFGLRGRCCASILPRVDERALTERLITYDTSTLEGMQAAAAFVYGWLEARDVEVKGETHNGRPVLAATVGAATGPDRGAARPPRRGARQPRRSSSRGSRATA